MSNEELPSEPRVRPIGPNDFWPLDIAYEPALLQLDQEPASGSDHVHISPVVRIKVTGTFGASPAKLEVIALDMPLALVREMAANLIAAADTSEQHAQHAEGVGLGGHKALTIRSEALNVPNRAARRAASRRAGRRKK